MRVNESRTFFYTVSNTFVRTRFTRNSVDVKADVVSTLPITPDKTPHAGEGTVNVLKEDVRDDDKGDDWDDWDESSDDGEVGSSSAGGGENLYEAALKTLISKLQGSKEMEKVSEELKMSAVSFFIA